MLIQPTHEFSWDRVFRPGVMARLLTFLGLRKEAIIRFLNYPQFAVVILLLVPYLILAPVVTLTLGRRADWAVQKVFGWMWLAVFGIYRRVWIHPEIRRDAQYVYMAEHFSLHDVPLYGSTWPTVTAALSAKEYANVPMYGWVIRAAGTQFIERRDTREAIADLHALRDRMGPDGLSVLVVPTGTRAENAQLLPFKKGVFFFSTELKKPIVPLCLVGLEHLRVGKNYCRPGRVDVVYGQPIRPEDHPEAFASPEALRDLVRARMLDEGRELRRQRQLLLRN